MNGDAAVEEEDPVDKPRKPWLAGLLSLICVGLGHIYTGKLKKGIILYICSIVLAILLISLFVTVPGFVTFIIIMICGLAYEIYVIVDAVKTARKNKSSYVFKPYNRWYVYAIIILVSGFIIRPVISKLIVRKNIMRAYKVFSKGMLPTLYKGDYVIANKLAYKFSEPKKGDIIVFEYPVNPSKEYVKRLIGVEGDTIEIRDKEVYINNEKLIEDYVIRASLDTIRSSFSNRDNFGPYIVPENSYFVMGDNRDGSRDSRSWGPLNKEKVKGRVEIIYFSLSDYRWKVEIDKKDMKPKIVDQGIAICWDRIGKIVK